MSLRDALIAACRDQGFDAVGFTPYDVLRDEAGDLAAYLAEGRHGSMAWMEREPEKRTDPRLLFHDTQTIMAVGANYFRMDLPESAERRIARYARGRDYHNFLPKRLRKAIRAVQAEYPALEAKVCVDTSPILEKPWAQRAGLGWQGKHTHLVSRNFGSWMILGVVLLNLPVEPDLPHADLCGTCTACVDACPTGALTPHRMDARKCISYLTIETRGPFAAGTPDLHGWAHGCDLCLEACPWNKFSVASHWADFTPRRTSVEPELLEDDERLAKELPGTPLARPGREGLRRNVAHGNAKNRAGEPGNRGAGER